MNVLLYLNRVQDKMGGGALGMWRTLEALERRGCVVRVAAKMRAGAAQVRGRTVHRSGNRENAAWADVILTGAGAAARHAGQLGRAGGAKTVCFVHSAITDPMLPRPASQSKCGGCHMVVWASRAIRDFCVRQGWGQEVPDPVLWPPVYAEDYRTMPGEAVTLVNLMPEKGGKLFRAIAEAMPETRFLGVHGGWGGQEEGWPPNVELLPYQDDVREVYRRTRVLLYPKGEEAGPGWMHGVGLTALEAACSGIPTIAYPGAGLVESLGDAGMFVASMEPGPWVEAIRQLQSEARWREASRNASKRAEALDPEGDMDRLMEALWAL